MNTIIFTIATGSIGEDLSKRKPLRIIGNPRQKYYTYKCLREGLVDTCNQLISMVNSAIDYNALSGSRRRNYQHLRNRHAALKYAKFLRDL